MGGGCHLTSVDAGTFWFKKPRMPVTIARDRPRAHLKRWHRTHRVGCCGGNSSGLHGLGVGPAAPHSREVTAVADVFVRLFSSA